MKNTAEVCSEELHGALLPSSQSLISMGNPTLTQSEDETKRRYYRLVIPMELCCLFQGRDSSAASSKSGLWMVA